MFVVGAGASCDFKLPLGADLVEEIIQQLLDDIVTGDDTVRKEQRLKTAFMAHHIGYDDQWFEAAVRLRGGLIGASSIDALLHSFRRDERVVRLGKMAIAARILLSEGNSEVARLALNNLVKAQKAALGLRPTWIGRFFSQVRGDLSPDEAAEAFENVTFVTFNYDRCIEFYLYYALRLICHRSVEEAREIVNSIPIHHVYGSLGVLPELEEGDARAFDNAVAVPFGDTRLNLDSVAKGLRTFREEGVDRGDGPDAVHAAIENAEQLVFLGFGFHEQNLRVLGPVRQGVPTFGTMRLAEPAQKSALKYLSQNEFPSTFTADSCGVFFDKLGWRVFSS